MNRRRFATCSTRCPEAHCRPTSRAAPAEHLARCPFEDLGFARVDHHRALRQGFPEVSSA